MENNVANRMVTLSVPFIKLDNECLLSDTEMKNYGPGVYIQETPTMYYFSYFDGNYTAAIVIPKEQIEKQIAIKAAQEERDNLSMLLSGYIESYTCEKAELHASLAVIKDAIENLATLFHKSVEAKQEGNTGNIDILAIAKACAVMQQPQLITELNKGK